MKQALLPRINFKKKQENFRVTSNQNEETGKNCSIKIQVHYEVK